MSLEFVGKVALVTGGAQGLGEALCQRLADEGADLVVADLNLAGAEKVAAEIAEKTGRKAIAVAMDVTSKTR